MLHIKSVKPLFTSVLVTADLFEENMLSEGGIIVAKKGDLKMWQKVIQVGDAVREVHAGDLVMINFDNFAVKKYNKNSVQNDLDNNPIISYKFDWVTIDDKDGKPRECMLINDRDIKYVFEGEEKSDVIIKPASPNLIV